MTGKVYDLKPIGVIPREIWDIYRMKDLKEALDRYTECNLEIPPEWKEEYNSLTKLYEK